MNTENTFSTISEIVRGVVSESYGIEGALTRLPGENLNFLVETPDGRKWVAKVAGKDQAAELIEMEHAALQWAERAELGLVFPVIIENKYGKLETGINIHIKAFNRLRLIEYISGANWSEYSDISIKTRFDLGVILARFDSAMVGFDHPQAHRKHRWDLADVGQHRGKAELVGELEKRDLLLWAFEQWTNFAAPFLAILPWQFIHGDGNPENIRIMDGRVIGLLDFGDSCYNPTVCELAICLAYQMMDQADPRADPQADPWAMAEPVIAGYQSLRPLSTQEKAVLEPLVCGRLAASLSVAAERRQIDESNANWFVSEAPAWNLLARLRASPMPFFARAC